MKKNFKIIVTIGLAYLLASCSAKVYAPVSHQLPMLEEEGELSLAAYTSSSGFNLQGAYALTDKIGIGSTLNYLYDETRNYDESYQKHRYAELSFIYSLNPFRFSPTVESLFSRQPIPDRYVNVAFLAGAGLGSGESKIADTFAEGSYTKLSAQANVSFVYESFFLGISPKVSYVSYYDYFIREDFRQPMEENLSVIFWEPAFFGGAQIGNVRLVTQIGFARPLGEAPSFNYSVSYVSVGLQVNLDT